MSQSPATLPTKPPLDPWKWKEIKLWEDSIMGDQPLGQNPGIKNIMDWAQNNNLNTLWDISSWEEDGDNIWKDWHIDNLPHWLNDEKDCLIQHLQGKTPSAKNSQDKEGGASAQVITQPPKDTEPSSPRLTLLPIQLAGTLSGITLSCPRSTSSAGQLHIKVL